jgi:Fe-S cluster assembly protein SufB
MSAQQSSSDSGSNASLGWLQIFALGLGGVSAAGLAARASQRRGRQVSLSNVSASEVNAVTVLEPSASVIAPEPSAATETTVEHETNAELRKMLEQPYEFGFTTDIESVSIPKGLNEETVRKISEIKKEPEWMLNFRLRAFRKWQSMEMPEWSKLDIEPIDFQDMSYYTRPKKLDKKASLDEVDPELLQTFEKLGIPLTEQKRLSNVAVDAVFDSESIGTTFQKELAEAGVIFCSISEAIQEHPDLVKKYLASVVPIGDNFFAALNSAVFSDGSFCYIPKGTTCPMEISTYFRMNSQNSGQFERTLIIAEDDSYVSYLEGCTAPMFDSKQLHAAVVELHAGTGAEIKYSTVQNWYAGDKDGSGGVLNLVTKRGLCNGDRSKISWTQVETGSAITWKYPSCILKGHESIGEFYSVALTNHHQEADTGTKMIHIGERTKSKIVSKGISAGVSKNTYRGQVTMRKGAENSRNHTVCDSLLIGDTSEASTFPYVDVNGLGKTVEHEASTSRINEEQIFYLKSRGITEEAAISLIINGFCQDIFNELPMEFAEESSKLLAMKLEGAVG